MVTSGGYGHLFEPESTTPDWNPMAATALAERGDFDEAEPDYPRGRDLADADIESQPFDLTDAEPEPYHRPRNWAAQIAAAMAATGAEVVERPDGSFEPVSEAPRPPTPVRPAPPQDFGLYPPDDLDEDGDPVEYDMRSWRRQQQDWKTDNGVPEQAKRRSTPPSWTTEGRRRRLIAKKAEQLGISPEEADRRTTHRPGATRARR